MHFKKILSLLFLIMLSLFVILACSSDSGSSGLGGDTEDTENTDSDEDNNDDNYENNDTEDIENEGYTTIVLSENVLENFSSEFIQFFKSDENVISRDEETETDEAYEKAISNIQAILTYFANNGVGNVTNVDLAASFGRMVAEYLNSMDGNINKLFYSNITMASNDTISSALEDYSDNFSGLIDNLTSANDNETNIVNIASSLMKKFNTEYQIAEYFNEGAQYISNAYNYYNNEEDSVDTESLTSAKDSYSNAFDMIQTYVDTYELVEKFDNFSNLSCTNVTNCKTSASSNFSTLSSANVVDHSNINTLFNAVKYTYLYLYAYLNYRVTPTSDGLSSTDNFIGTIKNSYDTVSLYKDWQGDNTGTYHVSTYADYALDNFSNLYADYKDSDNSTKNIYYLLTSIAFYIDYNTSYEETIIELNNSIFLPDVSKKPEEFYIKDYLW